MQISLEKVQFENDEDSLVIFEKQNVLTTNKSLYKLRVCGDIMFAVYKLNLNNTPRYIIQKISLEDPDIVVNLQHLSSSRKSSKIEYEKYLFDEIVDIFKVYNAQNNNSSLIFKALNGKKFEYFMYNQENSEVLLSLMEWNKRSMDVSCVSNFINSGDKILLGTTNGKVYFYTLSTNELLKLNQYTTSIKGLHYSSKQNELTCMVGVTIMKYKDIKDISQFNSERIPVEIENYGSEDVNKQEIDQIRVFENIHNGQYLINYKAILVMNKYTSGLSDGQILHKDKDTHIVDSCLTNYHILNIADNNKLHVINQFNFEDEINIEVEHTLSTDMYLEVDYISHDLTPTYWLYDTMNNVFEIIIQDETVDVVDDLLRLNKYAELLKFDLSEDKRQSIYEQYFDYLLKENADMDTLIKVGSKIKKNFTLRMNQIIKVVSKFNYDEASIMKVVTFLKLRMINFHEAMTENQIQLLLSMVIVFLVQLPPNTVNDKVLREFLVQNVDLLDKQMTKQLLSKSEGNLIFFMKLSKDYKSLIEHYIIQNNNFIDAVKVINVYCADDGIIYDTAAILLQNCPEEIVKAWVKLITNKDVTIDIRKLLPIFLDYYHKIYLFYDHSGSIRKLPNYCLWFLLWYHSAMEKSNRDVNDLIVYMMLNDKFEFDVDKIVSFIDSNWNCLDRFILLSVATNVASRSQKQCIHVLIYVMNKMKMYTESVKLALGEGLLDTARDVINSIDDEYLDTKDLKENKKLKRKLWLLIVEHTLTNSYKNNLNLRPIINDLIRESNDVINISDVFPIIEKMKLTVAIIKDEFIASLKNQNKELVETNNEIKSLVRLRQKILKDIDYLNNNLTHEVSDKDVCSSCHDNLVLKRKFYCFPCCHKLHVNCAMDLILKGGDFGLKNQIQNLMFKKEPKWLDKLNLLLAKKCPLCTDININNVDEPFVLDVVDDAHVLGGVGNSSVDYLTF